MEDVGGIPHVRQIPVLVTGENADDAKCTHGSLGGLEQERP